jgi:hypothetical protein
MPKSIVNLTNLIVRKEIEQAVKIHYHFPYQHIFANPDLRQELIAYVLTRVRNVHVAVEIGEESHINAEAVPCLTEIRLQIEDFIHQGIHHILQKYRSLVSHSVLDYGYLTPHWFS